MPQVMAHARAARIQIWSFFEPHVDGSGHDDLLGVGVSAQALEHVN